MLQHALRPDEIDGWVVERQRASESLDKRNNGYASCFRPTHGDGPQMRIRLDVDHLPGRHPSRGDRCDKRSELPAHCPRTDAKIDNVITRLDHGRFNCPVTKSPRRGHAS
jgi:hypothetical protein